MKRNTRQREVINHIFISMNRPLSPQEVTIAAQKSIPALGIATVYRALKELVQEGCLVPISVAGGTKYERSDLGHHHHFYCQKCDKTFDIQGCTGNLERLVPSGFIIASHELTINGTCCGCARQRQR